MPHSRLPSPVGLISRRRCCTNPLNMKLILGYRTFKSLRKTHAPHNYVSLQQTFRIEKRFFALQYVDSGYIIEYVDERISRGKIPMFSRKQSFQNSLLYFNAYTYRYMVLISLHEATSILVQVPSSRLGLQQTIYYS